MSAAEGVADAVENQAHAERDAMLADRLKMAGMVADHDACQLDPTYYILPT